MDLDDSAVVAADLDAVRGAVIPDLRLEDRATPGVLERGLRGSVEIGAGQRRVVRAIREGQAHAPGGHGQAKGSGRDPCRSPLHERLPMQISVRNLRPPA